MAMDTEWADYCSVEVEEEEAHRWLCDVATCEEDHMELDESFPQLDPQKVAEVRAEELAYTALWLVEGSPHIAGGGACQRSLG